MVVNVQQRIMMFAFILFLLNILLVEMIVKVTYRDLKRMIIYYMFTMIYGEILKTGENWLRLLNFSWICLVPIQAAKKKKLSF